MSKKLITKNNPIEQVVMQKIIHGQVAMKPRWYFVLGSFILVLGLSALLIAVIFSLNLLFFSLRSHGPMGELRLTLLTQSFPWWAVAVATVSGIFGVKLLKLYDFAYRKNFSLILLGILLAVLVSAWAIDYLGINELFVRRGGFMRQLYFQSQGWGRYR